MPSSVERQRRSAWGRLRLASMRSKEPGRPVRQGLLPKRLLLRHEAQRLEVPWRSDTQPRDSDGQGHRRSLASQVARTLGSRRRLPVRPYHLGGCAKRQRQP